MDSRHSEFTHRLTADFQYAHCDFHNYFADIHAYRDLKKTIPCDPSFLVNPDPWTLPL
jgi:hypothetical protein